MQAGNPLENQAGDAGRQIDSSGPYLLGRVCNGTGE
jgi:hypothetical protein